eukprot:TRINITY_DN7003_c0_g2_i1.p1 TRINITY_DN7003_c0_g2~~TRINITY_DN7003_c0_g2_i1.p1  ORF type:complete len:769 (-),score=119.40 TRINITY_DN7003_c0_g2_i1:92-2398(-)
MGNSDSHAAFADGVRRLLDEPVPPSDEAFWASLLNTEFSVEDIFSIINPEDVRQLRAKQPKNLQALLRKITDAVHEVYIEADTDTATTILPSNAAARLYTCVRLLTRLLPLLMEDAKDDETLRSILWSQEGLGPEDKEQAEPREPEEPLGKKILGAIMRCLFLQGFTVQRRGGTRDAKSSTNAPQTHRVDSNVVWKGGVGVAAELPAMQNAHLPNRCEVLHCLLACLSGPLFQTADEYQERPPLWLSHFTGGDVVHTASLFCSLMSTVFSYAPNGWMPYGGVLAGNIEAAVVDAALQVLCVAIDFDPSSTDNSGDEVGAGNDVLAKDPQAPDGKKVMNVYRYMLQNVSKDNEIDLMFKGIVRMLSSVYEATTTYLPNSVRSVGFYQEALVLLWHLITLNQAFLKRVVERLDTNQLVMPILYLLQQAQHSPQLVGLLHTATFVLLVLSSERSFAVRLNEPYTGKTPLRVPHFQGCQADLLTLAVHKVISDALAKPSSDALVEMLLTVLCNISPYVKSFALESCLKLLSLIERCGRPAYVFRSAYTHNGLCFLLEMIANIIQYQYEGNTMLIYSILRQRQVFDHISTLQIPAKRKSNSGHSGNGAAAGSRDEEGSTSSNGNAGGDSQLAASENQTTTSQTTADEAHAKPTANEAHAATAAWEPTEDWLASVKRKMPLQVLQCMIDDLSTKVDELCKKYDVVEQDEVIKFLKTTTMVGILPVPHPLVIRTYQASPYTMIWFTTYLWGVIFTRSQHLPLYDWNKIRLVSVNH